MYCSFCLVRIYISVFYVQKYIKYCLILQQNPFHALQFASFQIPRQSALSFFRLFNLQYIFSGMSASEGGRGGIPHSFILECLIHFKLSLLWRQSSQAVDSRSKHVFCQGCHSAILPIYIKCLFKLLWSLSYYEVGGRWDQLGKRKKRIKIKVLPVGFVLWPLLHVFFPLPAISHLIPSPFWLSLCLGCHALYRGHG